VCESERKRKKKSLVFATSILRFAFHKSRSELHLIMPSFNVLALIREDTLIDMKSTMPLLAF
jgi:hypothetical protein